MYRGFKTEVMRRKSETFFGSADDQAYVLCKLGIGYSTKL